MKPGKLVAAGLGAIALTFANVAPAADAICYNCPPQWADWASMLKAIENNLGYKIPHDNKNSGQTLSQLIAEKGSPVADVAYYGVSFGLKVRKVSGAESARRVREMLEMMDIVELKDREIDQLSGGQRQRVALARAIAVQPRVLLLDEPLTALDALLRERLRVDIDALLRRLGITAIYVTHDQAEAMALGDRIVVMSHGDVAQVGTPRQIYFRPSNRFVADFIGTMNRVCGVIDNGVVRTAAGRIPWSKEGEGEIEMLFRPENLTITDPGEGHLAGVVQTVFFLGDRTRVIVRGDGNTVLVVETSDRHEFAQGESVGLVVGPDTLSIPDGEAP